jgi:hypothetical protein
LAADEISLRKPIRRLPLPGVPFETEMTEAQPDHEPKHAATNPPELTNGEVLDYDELQAASDSSS